MTDASFQFCNDDTDTFQNLGDNTTRGSIDPNNIPHADLLEDLWLEHGDFGVAFAAWMEQMAKYAELRAEYDVDALEAARAEYRLALSANVHQAGRSASVDKRRAQRAALLAIVPILGLEATARYVDESLTYTYSVLFNGRTDYLGAHLAAERLLSDPSLSWTEIGRRVGCTAQSIGTLASMLNIKNPTSGRGGCHTYTPAQRDEARRLWSEGWGTHAQIAAEVGCPRTAVVGWCRNIKSAAVVAAKARRAQERAAKQSEPKLVVCTKSRSSYNLGCKCDDCRRADSEYHVEQRRKAKARRVTSA